MLKAVRIFPAAILLLLATVATSLFAQATSQKNPNAPPINTPLAFEANRGQTAPQVKYLARSREGVVFLTSQGFTVALPHFGSFRALFDQAATAPVITGEGPLIARSNYLDRGKSIVNVPNFDAVVYRRVYPGIDVRFYGRGMHLEHDFLVSPGADAGKIALRLEGVDRCKTAEIGRRRTATGRAEAVRVRADGVSDSEWH